MSDLLVLPELDSKIVASSDRLDFLPKMLGQHHVLFETALYKFADMLSDEYRGGVWEFVSIADGKAFYAYPNDDAFEGFNVASPNGYANVLDNKFFGYLATTFALNALTGILYNTYVTSSNEHIQSCYENICDKYEYLVSVFRNHSNHLSAKINDGCDLTDEELKQEEAVTCFFRMID